jgi:ParB-like chromosome segregation protein Spo0J
MSEMPLPSPRSSALDPALALAVTYRSVDDLAPLGRKSRAHSKDQIARLTEAIRTFGFLVPILVDQGGKVLAGNGRLEAARRLGLIDVPIIAISHLDEAAKRAFVLAENRLAELAEWDDAVLRVELQELRDLDFGFGIALTGFSDVEVEAIVFDGARIARLFLEQFRQGRAARAARG